MRKISVSRFKTHCLALLDEVEATGEPLIVTRRGRPLVRVEPIKEAQRLGGSVTQLVSDEELVAPIDVEWDALRDH